MLMQFLLTQLFFCFNSIQNFYTVKKKNIRFALINENIFLVYKDPKRKMPLIENIADNHK